MFYCRLLIAFSSVASVFTTNALILSSPTTSARVSSDYIQHGLTTPPPSLPFGLDLRKRKVSPGTECGWLVTYSEATRTTWEPWYVSDGYYCAATILPDGSAYAYSSDPEVGAQYRVWTTAIGHWDSEKPCPSSATCCSGNNPVVQTYYFSGGPSYTITSWWCSTTQLTQTWTPAPNLFQTKDFSISLARATASVAAEASGGISSDTKIGIGVGVAVGVGVIVFAGAVFFFWRRRHRRSKANMNGPPQMPYRQGAPYDPRNGYNLHAWNNNFTYDYYKHDTPTPPWPASPAQALRLQELHGSARTEEVQELPGRVKSARLFERQREQSHHELSAEY